ncbi:hypothetical protein FXO38_12108 [Capsicum annuum]|nr:hypothetical protein FXO38_12108 [Capsicum annuum]KAF3669217.1 hypothetical protein FXO37_09149 [Capsicum annuum]
MSGTNSYIVWRAILYMLDEPFGSVCLLCCIYDGWSFSLMFHFSYKLKELEVSSSAPLPLKRDQSLQSSSLSQRQLSDAKLCPHSCHLLKLLLESRTCKQMTTQYQLLVHQSHQIGSHPRRAEGIKVDQHCSICALSHTNPNISSHGTTHMLRVEVDDTSSKTTYEMTLLLLQ